MIRWNASSEQKTRLRIHDRTQRSKRRVAGVFRECFSSDSTSILLSLGIDRLGRQVPQGSQSPLANNIFGCFNDRGDMPPPPLLPRREPEDIRPESSEKRSSALRQNHGQRSHISF